MGEPQLRHLDIAGFLAWEETQELRHEFDGIQTIAMTGGTDAHAAIQFGIARAVGNRLLGTPCRAYGSHLKVRTNRAIRYPDAFIVCSPRIPSAKVVCDPVVIFEILSESTAHEDLVVKAAEYQAIPSLQRYVILRQTHRIAMVFHRKDAAWEFAFVSGEDAELEMPEVGISVPLADIYRDIALEGDPSAMP